MNSQTNVTPIIAPLVALLRSRKFMVGLMALVIDVLVAYVPALEPVRGDLLTVFTLLGAVLVASIALEDGLKGNSK